MIQQLKRRKNLYDRLMILIQDGYQLRCQRKKRLHLISPRKRLMILPIQSLSHHCRKNSYLSTSAFGTFHSQLLVSCLRSFKILTTRHLHVSLVYLEQITEIHGVSIKQKMDTRLLFEVMVFPVPAILLESISLSRLSQDQFLKKKASSLAQEYGKPPSLLII